jgi:uncharacterized protein (TIGR03437 family)
MKWILPLMAAVLLMHAPGLQAQVTLSSAVNAGSYANPSMPNGSLTQGAIFITFGSGMGPAKLQEISAFPLPTNLGGTSIAVTVNGTTVNCIMLYTSAGQVAAVLPSDTPTGSGTMVLSYNQSSSAALNVTVSAHDFGIFAVNQGGNGAGVLTNAITNVVNSQTASANPGDLVDIWGTGLGAVTGDEAAAPLPGNIPNLPLQVFVGSVQAQVNYAGRSGCCTGLDQIEIIVPSGIVGCAVPVYFVVGGVTSNFVTMSIAQSGPTCVNPGAYTSSQLQVAQANGGLGVGAASLERFHEYTVAINYESDSASVVFEKVPLVDLQGPAVPPAMANTCTILTFPGGVGAGGGGAAVTYLQAGTITLSGAVGPYTLVSPQPGDYQVAFLPSEPGNTPGIINDGTVLIAGNYTLTGTAGPDIGAFTANLSLPPPLVWTNRPTIPATVDRSQPLTITWTNGYPGALVLINGQSQVSQGVGANFDCWADATAGTFTVPAAILQAVPPTYSVSGNAQGSLDVYQVFNGPAFTAPEIDVGTTGFADGYDVGAITYK